MEVDWHKKGCTNLLLIELLVFLLTGKGTVATGIYCTNRPVCHGIREVPFLRGVLFSGHILMCEWDTQLSLYRMTLWTTDFFGAHLISRTIDSLVVNLCGKISKLFL